MSEQKTTNPFSKRMKLMLLKEMDLRNVRPCDLARKMNKSQQTISRLTNINYTSNANHMQEAFKAIGVTVELKTIET